MALVNCPDCGGSVSTAAAACPKCGYPIDDRPPRRRPSRGGGGAGGRGVLVGCLTAGVILAVVGVVCGGLMFGLPYIQKQREAEYARTTILGKWRQADGSLELEFFANGTLAEKRLLDTGRGTYRLLPNKRMELKVDALFWGQNEVTVKYELTDDELTLVPETGSGMVLRYKKVR